MTNQELIDRYEMNLAKDWYWYTKNKAPFFFVHNLLNACTISQLKVIGDHIGNKISTARLSHQKNLDRRIPYPR